MKKDANCGSLPCNKKTNRATRNLGMRQENHKTEGNRKTGRSRGKLNDRKCGKCHVTKNEDRYVIIGEVRRHFDNARIDGRRPQRDEVEVRLSDARQTVGDKELFKSQEKFLMKVFKTFRTIQVQ